MVRIPLGQPSVNVEPLILNHPNGNLEIKINPHCVKNHGWEEKSVDNPVSYQQFTAINFVCPTNSIHYKIQQF